MAYGKTVQKGKLYPNQCKTVFRLQVSIAYISMILCWIDIFKIYWYTIFLKLDYLKFYLMI